ncbi:MAG: hypothetical protein ABJE95_29210, partial [Byssovorax sp.]
MRYFSNSQDDLDLVELEPVPETEKAHTAPGDSLSFDGLEDRRFEVLAYKLTAAEPGGARAHLMSGVRDKGRDIIVYSDAGKLVAIKQCKKYRDRLDEPTVRREMLKLAIHSYREPAILGSGPVVYELWCPGGLFETAESLFLEWPNRWTEMLLASDAAKVLREYAAFGELVWDDVKEYIVTKFPRIVTPGRLGALDISGRVRNHPTIFEEFFQVTSVMRTQDVRDFFSQLGIAELTDDHGRHVLGRIKQFPPEQRLVA